MAPRGMDGSMLGPRFVKPTAASNIPLVFDIMEDKDEQLGCLPPMYCSVWTNMMFVVPVVLTLSIALGTSFYFFYEHWELSTCYYYASQVLNGNMFDTPSQPDDDHTGLWFTLLLYVYGSTLMASAYGAFASVIVENSFKLATHLRKEHHDECRKSIRGISFRNLPLDNPLIDPFGGPLCGPFDGPPGGGMNKHVPTDQRSIITAGASSAAVTGTSLYGSLAPQVGYSFLRSTDDTTDTATKTPNAYTMGINKHRGGMTTTTMMDDDNVDVDDDNDDNMLVPSSSSSYIKRALIWLGWEEHKGKYRTLFATTLWLIIGVSYGVIYEGWGVTYALRFAIGTLSASGSPTPVCTTPTSALPDSPCQLGVARGLFVGTYILVGVPLWAFTLGQFSMVIVERAVRRRELELMARPLTQQEFSFASKVSDRRSSARSSGGSSGGGGLKNGKKGDAVSATATAARSGRSTGSGSGSSSGIGSRAYEGEASSSSSAATAAATAATPIVEALNDDNESQVLDFGEFVVLEMLRLQRIDLDDLASMRAIFDAMDQDKSGDISYDEVKRYHMLTRGRAFSNSEV